MLTQYKSHSLDRHLATTWSLSPLLGNYVTPVPAQMRRGPRWFAGSADAIYQSLNLIYDERPDYIVVFGADHIYRTDPRQMVAQHLESGAGLTVAGHPGPDRAGRPVRGDRGRHRRPEIKAFHEKPDRRRRAARRPRPGAGLDGQLRLRREDADRRRHAPTRRTRSRATTSGATSSRDGRRAAPRRSGTSQRRAVPGMLGARARRTGATSGRSTPTTTRTWT